MIGRRSSYNSTISHPQRTPPIPSRINRQSCRSGSRSVPNFPKDPSGLQSDGMGSSPIPNLPLQRRDSDPGAPDERRQSVPVKCPPRQTNRTSGPGTSSSPTEIEDSNYLMRVYDTRTWEMYRRITEARKNSQYSYASNNDAKAHLDHAPKGENTSEWENLQHDFSDMEAGHEMIFLFDFD